MAGRFDRIDTATLGPVHWVAIALALVTAGVHFYLWTQDLTGGFGISFLIASGGFVAGIAAVLAGYRRRLVYLLGIPFVGGQIVLWFALNQPIPPISALEIVDKVAQVLLVVLLVLLARGD